jgi:hypothetical protein
MYTISVEVEGTTPLLQHKFGGKTQAAIKEPSKKVIGKLDYSLEWLDSCYQEDGNLVQPGNHFEGAMIKAAVSEKIQGARGKSYKDLFLSAVYVRPVIIPFNMKIPKDPGTNLFDEPIYIDERRAVVQRAPVMRRRLAFAPGWKLAFMIEVNEDEKHLQREVVNKVLVQAGRYVGIGDYRPRFGLFMVTKFE